MPITVTMIAGVGNEAKLTVENGFVGYILEGASIVDDSTGDMYRVRESGVVADQITLDHNWIDTTPPTEKIWVVPPAKGGGRYPCVGIYDRSISSTF